MGCHPEDMATEVQSLKTETNNQRTLNPGMPYAREDHAGGEHEEAP